MGSTQDRRVRRALAGGPGFAGIVEEAVWLRETEKKGRQKSAQPLR